MNTLTKIGRIVYAIPFLVFGMMHLMKADAMAGMIPSFIPGGILWVYLTGLALIAAAVSIFIQKQIRLACLMLAGMLMVFILTLHIPGVMSGDQMMMQMAMSGMLKDLALAGGALVIAGLYSDKN